MVVRSTSKRAASASSVMPAAFIQSLSFIGAMCHEGTTIINPVCAPAAKDSCGAWAQPLCMHGTKRTYIREWRQHRELTLEKLAERIGITHGALSKIERGQRPYSQALLEALAGELGTDPASLLMRNPGDPEGIWSIWDRVPPADRPRAINVLKALTRTGS